MDSAGPTSKIKIPKGGNWPGAFGAYQLVKPYLKPQIWNLISVAGLLFVFDIIIDIFLGRHNIKNQFSFSIPSEVVGLIVWSFFKSTFKIMYFTYLDNKDISLNEALTKTRYYFLRMFGLSFITTIVLTASVILLVIPFFFILPRIYLAPYFLVKNDLPVNQAIAASWHSSRGNVGKVYGIIAINVGLILLSITIIGIPFAIYWGMINTGSFALLSLYLSQSKNKTNLESQTS